ncbi:MFS general substrate transporter [Gymnopus androsaceus JB14]|uniref:MFS general substrate transporter n=1 Tax=Gymnopus androsaceus JB14 TaxID=1447944 RepID=A0A6A4HPV1_9AGAR|nr:MFS general substrate transporter [Gymnopus androsaceus JB14]
MSAGFAQTDALETETVHEIGTSQNSNERTYREAQEGDENEKTEIIVEDFPDGGLRAWSIVIGHSPHLQRDFGFVNSWGVFQSYYEQSLLKDSSSSDIAWIGSVQYALVFLPGLVTGRMFDIGIFKLPYAIASLVLVATSFLTAQCTEYWQFLLCQGIALGLACGMLFGPSMGIIGHWFKKKRGLALAVNAFGSSLGGTIIPIATRRLIVEVGRTLTPKTSSGGLFNLAAFKSPAFSAYCASSFITFLGLYTVLTYIDVSASSIGIDDNFSFYLVSITNAASGFGRLTSGVALRILGAINFMAPMTLVAGVLTYAWPFATTKAEFIVVGVIYGFASGVYISCFLLPIYEMSEVNDIGRRTGMILSIGATGALLGPPISGAINTNTGGFKAVGYYAGSMIILAAAFMILTRQIVLKKISGRF